METLSYSTLYSDQTDGGLGNNWTLLWGFHILLKILSAAV